MPTLKRVSTLSIRFLLTLGLLALMSGTSRAWYPAAAPMPSRPSEKQLRQPVAPIALYKIQIRSRNRGVVSQ